MRIINKSIWDVNFPWPSLTLAIMRQTLAHIMWQA
jgi:hypothetical protein